MSNLRLDKYLANAGIGTRSEIKKYIRQGFVCVNCTKTTNPDIKINLKTDQVYFKNHLIELNEFEYYILNKPAGYVSATKDNTALTVLSLIKSNRKDLFPVGRLDKDTEGLLLITNDGSFSHKILSPKHHVNKTYYAIVEGEVNSNDICTFKQGVIIGDEDLPAAMPAKLTVIEPYNEESNLSYVHVTIQEGKFHQVKRMFQAVGKKVVYLKRIQIGALTLPEDLPLGGYRPLTEEEHELLLK